MNGRSLRQLKSLPLRVPPFTVFVMALLLTAMATAVAIEKSRAEQQSRLERFSRRTIETIQARMEVYVGALLGARSFQLASTEVSRDEFRRFVAGLELEERAPGVQSIWFARRVPRERLSAHLRELRAGGTPSYEVWPLSTGPELFPAVLIEPLNARNRRAFGFDIASDPSRASAIEDVVRTGRPAVTPKLRLILGDELDGFNLYVPVFKDGAPVATTAQRRQALVGIAGATFLSKAFFGEILRDELVRNEFSSYEIFDGTATDESQLLYSTRTGDTPSPAMKAVRTPITIADHTWTVVVTAPRQTGFDGTALLVLALGLVISLLIYLYARSAILANEELGKSERHVKLITDSLPMLISYVDRDERYRFVNKTYMEWYGISMHSIEGKTAGQIHGPEIYSWYRPLAERVFAGETVTFERRLNHRTKGPRLAQIHYIPDRRPDGSIPGLVILANDITEQRAVAEKLAEERKTLELVTDVGLSLRSEMDVEKLCQHLLEIASQLLHATTAVCFLRDEGENDMYIAAGAVGLRPSIDLPKRVPLAQMGYLASALQNPAAIRHDDVGQMPAFTTNRPGFADKEQPVPWKSFMAVPLLSRAGEIRAVSRVKDEFLATLSHELRTPLNVILGHTELLQDEPSLHDAAPSVDAIQRNAKVLQQIIGDLLDISAVITGKISIRPERMDACETVKAALDTVRFAAASKGVNLSYRHGQDGCQIVGDATRIQQVVWNLLTNAVKFTPPGGHVDLSLREQDGFVVIEVRDDGIGIDPEFVPYVFDRFRQEDSSFTRRFGGLGLGLNIARQLTELHGGSIEVRSEGKGQGSVFSVKLPMASSLPLKAPAAAPAEAASPVTLPPLFHVNLLVVDDEADGRTLLSTLLSRAGADVRAAASADEARRLYEERRPDLILSDIGMPDRDGLSFLREIRAIEAERGLFTPAIALTAYAREEDRNQVLAAGFQLHLSKPIQSEQLLQAIGKTLVPHALSG